MQLPPIQASANAQVTKPHNDQKLQQRCQEFEAVLVQGMLKSMRATIPDGGLLPKSNDRQIFEELLDREMSMSMARTGNTGIAANLYRELSSPNND